MNNEAKNPLQKMIDDTVALLNKRKLTDAILSAQTLQKQNTTIIFTQQHRILWVFPMWLLEMKCRLLTAI